MPTGIGTLRERPLHAALKAWYAKPGDRIEAPVDGFVIDIVRGSLLIEVQTRGFSAMRHKLTTLLGRGYTVRVVHPVPVEKWIVKLDSDGTVASRRRSPRRGRVTDVFAELVSFPSLLTQSDLEIDVVSIREEELREHTPGRSWRRRGWSVVERRLIDVVETVPLREADDLQRLLPDDLAERFTTAELGASLGRPRRAAQQMAYCLREAGVITAVGKQGNAFEYEIRR